MKRQIQLMLILVTVSAVFSEEHRYCFLDTCPERSHTLCKYNNTGPVESCGLATHVGLTASEKHILIHLYNNNRPSLTIYEEPENFEVDPLNIKTVDYKVQWDEELAEIAQRWADQCINVEDTCRNVERFKVRQRAGLQWSPKNRPRPSIYTLVSRWFAQDSMLDLDSIDFDKMTLDEFSNIASNYFSRMMKQTADRFGCGAVRSTDEEYQNLYLVCNFGPA